MLAGSLYAVWITLPAALGYPSSSGGHGSSGTVLVGVILGGLVGLVMGTCVGGVSVLVHVATRSRVRHVHRAIVASSAGAICGLVMFGALGGRQDARGIAETLTLGVVTFVVLFGATFTAQRRAKTKSRRDC
jgi:site-specific recombinase